MSSGTSSSSPHTLVELSAIASFQVSSCRVHAELLNELFHGLLVKLLFSGELLLDFSDKLLFSGELLSGSCRALGCVLECVLGRAALLQRAPAALSGELLFSGEFFSGSCRALE